MDFVFFEGKKRSLSTSRARKGIVSMPVQSRTAASEDETFLDLLKEIGLPVDAYRRKALVRRLGACLRYLRVPDLTTAKQRLIAEPSLAQGILNVTMLGVTEFFRDRMVFNQVEDILATAFRQFAGPLRVWSAGCSTGAELYSIGILLGEAGLLDKAELLGTDFRPEAVQYASRGEYPAAYFKNVESHTRQHFTETRSGMLAGDHLRTNLHWKRSDLLTTTEPGPWNLILWRNVAIYLESIAATRIWCSLIESLAPNGYIVTGKADHLRPHPLLVKIKPCIYKKIPYPEPCLNAHHL